MKILKLVLLVFYCTTLCIENFLRRKYLSLKSFILFNKVVSWIRIKTGTAFLTLYIIWRMRNKTPEKKKRIFERYYKTEKHKTSKEIELLKRSTNQKLKTISNITGEPIPDIIKRTKINHIMNEDLDQTNSGD